MHLSFVRVKAGSQATTFIMRFFCTIRLKLKENLRITEVEKSCVQLLETLIKVSHK